MVLDSNQIIPDFLFKNTESIRFLELLYFADCGLCVPAPVIAEVEGNYRSSVLEAQKALESIGRVADLPLSQADLEAKQETYGDFLSGKLDDYTPYLPDYPDISHREVVERIHAGLRPFRGASKPEVGYRDFLIWRSVVELLKMDTKAEVAFVTDNCRDFCSEARPSELHEDLISDLSVEQIAPVRLRFFRSKRELQRELTKRADRDAHEFLESHPTWRADFARTRLPDLINGCWNKSTRVWEGDPCSRRYCMRNVSLRLTSIEKKWRGYRLEGIAEFYPSWHFEDPSVEHMDNSTWIWIRVDVTRELRLRAVRVHREDLPVSVFRD